MSAADDKRPIAYCVDEVDIDEVWHDRDSGQITTVVVAVTRANGEVERYTVLTEPS